MISFMGLGRALLAFATCISCSAASRPAVVHGLGSIAPSTQEVDKAAVAADASTLSSIRRAKSGGGSTDEILLVGATGKLERYSAPTEATLPQAHLVNASLHFPRSEPTSLLGVKDTSQVTLMTQASRWGRIIHKWAFPSQGSPHHWAPATTFAEHAAHVVVMQKNSPPNHTSTAMQESQWRPEPRRSDMWQWTFRFVLAFLSLALLTWCAAGTLKVENSDGDDEEPNPEFRGRPCCTYCCAVMTVALSSIVFTLALLVLNAENIEFERHRDLAPGNVTLTITEGNRTIHLTQVDSPGERAFEAGTGVALSVFVAIFVLCSWRHLNAVRLRLDLMAQFAVRGAILSSFLAGVLEIAGSVAVLATRSAFAAQEQGKLMEGFNLWTIAMMAVVGMSEEFAKFIVTIWGTWYREDSLHSMSTQSRCSCVWPTLVQSPHGMMLIGLSAGFGFMVIENAGYLLSVACMQDDDAKVDVDTKPEVDMMMRIMRLVTIVIRVVLNLHPYLSGLVAGRFASVLVKHPRDGDNLTAKELLWVLWPSAALHASYDLLVTVLPGILGLLMPPIFWYIVRQQFRSEWDAHEGVRTWPATGSTPSTEDAPGKLADASAAEVLNLRSEVERLRRENDGLRASMEKTAPEAG